MLPLIVIATLGVWTTDLDRDEEVVFFPSYACRDADDVWRANARGWVFEIDSASAIASTLGDGLGIAATAIESVESSALLVQRATPFFVDNERGQRISIRAGGCTFVSGPSEKSGHFVLPVRFTSAQVAELDRTGDVQDGWLRYTANVKAGDGRAPLGEINFIPENGISVISDIDDTIKVSDVRDKKSLIINTFLKPFEAAPGMATLYGEWARRGNVVFHYVSASPYQLYIPLREFIDGEGFPPGTYFLKAVRVKDPSALQLLGSQDDFKTRMIQPIMADFPLRRFVLVGDSGEQDPEIYGELARTNPGQVARILIRNTTGEPGSAERYVRAFRGLETGVWTVFDDPSQLAGAFPSR